jgi:general secretion pathway protein L
MKALSTFLGGLSRGLDEAALGVVLIAAATRRRRVVKMVEQPDGAFRVRLPGAGAADGPTLRLEGARFITASADARKFVAGARVEIELTPSRFVFRPLGLPRRAGEFLDGVVRSQIDRLTPWTAAEAAFGYAAPTDEGSQRIAVVVAATARTTVASIAEAAMAFGAESVKASTRPDTQGAAPIEVFAERSRTERRVHGVKRRLAACLALASAAAALSLIGAVALGGDADARLTTLERRIAARHAALVDSRGGREDAAIAELDARKRASPLGVLVLEALSRILPDDTYLDELRIEGDKIQIAGMTRDAPALIALIERSRRFARAMFFSPTTRGPGDNADSFHIEAHIEPAFATGERP